MKRRNSIDMIISEVQCISQYIIFICKSVVVGNFYRKVINLFKFGNSFENSELKMVINFAAGPAKLPEEVIT